MKMRNELQKQLDAIKLKMKKEIMQDASFITSDHGHAKRVVHHAKRKPRLGGARVESGRRRERNPILDTSFMVSWRGILAVFVESRLQLLKSTIAR